MTKGYNFGAGPAMLPEVILQDVQAELLDWQGSGMSILEVGHRTERVEQLMHDMEKDLRTLLRIPDDYHVLFLSGPARTQFAMIPLNFIDEASRGAYLISGHWSQMAYQEASRISRAYCLASSAESQFKTLPIIDANALSPDTAYVYYTPNETIQGVQFHQVPFVFNRPLVADMTSCLLTEPIDVRDYDLIFAGVQKNIAPAGLTVVILSDALLKKQCSSVLPTMMDYRVQIDAHSLYATPALFQCYVASKMLKWIQSMGGVAALAEQNKEKASRLYHYLDASDVYQCRLSPAVRSRVNVCFSLRDKAREPAFLAEAHAQKLYALQGHRLVGGCRASLYNAMPLAGVERLIAFMDDFAKRVVV